MIIASQIYRARICPRLRFHQGQQDLELGGHDSERRLFQVRLFYLAYREKVQTMSAQSSGITLTWTFPLLWSHYVRLLSVKNLMRGRSMKPKPYAVAGPSASSIDRSQRSGTNAPRSHATRPRCSRRAVTPRFGLDSNAIMRLIDLAKLDGKLSAKIIMRRSTR